MLFYGDILFYFHEKDFCIRYKAQKTALYIAEVLFWIKPKRLRIFLLNSAKKQGINLAFRLFVICFS